MANRTCMIDGCDAPARTRWMCGNHYYRWRKAGADPATAGPPIGRPTRRVGVASCSFEGCPKPMHARDLCVNHYATLKRAQKRDGVWVRKHVEQLPPVVEIPCGWCGETFLPARRNNTYCSRSCRSRHSRKHGVGTPCSVEGCDYKAVARALCNSHYKFKFRAPTERRRLHDGGINAERISRHEVGERDGWVCGICRDAIDAELVWPDPRSQSLDHIVPVSKGGRHQMDNVRIAHVTCNAARGNRDDIYTFSG